MLIDTRTVIHCSNKQVLGSRRVAHSLTPACLNYSVTSLTANKILHKLLFYELLLVE